VTFPPGWHPAIPPEAYHADPALSSTGIRHLLKSPLHFQDWRTSEPADSPARLLGRALHCAVLEPERFPAAYAIAPALDRRTKAGKEAWEGFLLEHPGAEVLTAEQGARVAAMAGALVAHPLVTPLLRGTVELSGFWTDPATGVACRCRPDLVHADGEVLLDLKTTRDASPEGFRRELAKWGLHNQAAHYHTGARAQGAKAADLVLLAVESDPPYAVGVYRLDDDAIDVGARRCREALETFARCTRTDTWPGYDPHILPLALPAWAVPFDEED